MLVKWTTDNPDKLADPDVTQSPCVLLLTAVDSLGLGMPSNS